MQFVNFFQPSLLPFLPSPSFRCDFLSTLFKVISYSGFVMLFVWVELLFFIIGIVDLVKGFVLLWVFFFFFLLIILFLFFLLFLFFFFFGTTFSGGLRVFLRITISGLLYSGHLLRFSTAA